MTDRALGITRRFTRPGTHPYDEVAWGHTGHVEVVQVKYDPKVVGYDKLVDYFFRHVDVLDAGGQFSDRGDSYRPVIFTYTPEQQRVAEASKAALDASKRFPKPVAVKIEPAKDFTPADDTHQKFYTKNTFRYKFYRLGSGRDARLQQLWGSETAAH
jgi:methionine-S-sulfoxide reductase